MTVRFLETAFLVDLLRGDPHAVRRGKMLQDSGEIMAIAAPCVAEILRGAGRVGGKRRSDAEALLEQLEIFPLDERAARLAGALAAESARRGNEVAMMDCLVAGIVMSAEGTLVTRDSDFARLPGLSLETY